MKMKSYVRDVVPPFIWRAARKAKRSLRSNGASSRWIYGVEQPMEFYEEKFKVLTDLHRHYTESKYYPLWTVIADRIRRYESTSILDIGCGSGQLACVLRDQGVPRYTGLDFSPARVERARENCPEYDFFIEDVYQTKLIETQEYDCVVITEVLEHIQEDLGVLHRIPRGLRVLATVPNYPAAGHVRYFESSDEVEQRYRGALKDLRVHPMFMNSNGGVIFILDGIR